MAESGVPRYEASLYDGFASPSGTSKKITHLLQHPISDILNQTKIRHSFESQGGKIVASTPEAFAQSFKNDEARLGQVIKAAGIQPE